MGALPHIAPRNRIFHLKLTNVMNEENHSVKETASSVPMEFSGIDGQAIWLALAQTPGIGISITDENGQLLFVNNTSLVLFSGSADIDYHGKTIADFHPPEYVAERLKLIRLVLAENRPVRVRHVYHGKSITSTVWPLPETASKRHRVLVVSQSGPDQQIDDLIPNTIETFPTDYIDLGPLNVLSRRELEVLVLLGHGLTIPETAKLLHRSPKTIERHKESIGRKLALKRQSDLVELVTSVGLQLTDTKLKRY